jgi:uncharacterized protein with HEPN domain
MPPRALKTLEDIRDDAAFVREVTARESLESYVANRLLRQAVERNFEIIGEAIRRLRDHTPEVARQLTDHTRIIGFRNLLIHGYDLVDDGLVWDTIQHHLPTLLSEVATEMQRLQQEQDRFSG